MARRLRSGLLALFVTMIPLSCSPDGTIGPGSNPGGMGREVQEDPQFSTTIQDIFSGGGCTNGACHGVGASAGLNLEAGESYAALVGVASTQEGYERVTSGNATESYLIIKVEGRQAVGGRMPLGGFPLDPIDIQNLKNWIDKGAKNN